MAEFKTDTPAQNSFWRKHYSMRTMRFSAYLSIRVDEALDK